MSPGKFLKAILYPVTESSVLIPVIVLWLLMSFAELGGALGYFLMFLVIPAVFRYQMIILEARANDRVPPVPDTDFFRWFGNAWSLFPVPLVLLAIWVVVVAGEEFGNSGVIIALAGFGVLLPASFAVLAITHSPLQSLNPVALFRLLKKCGDTFWIASVYMFVAGWLVFESEALPNLLANLVAMLLNASVFSLIGSVIEPYGLMSDVSIPDSPHVDENDVAAAVEKHRVEHLNHAYGFISRGNRDGGFKHIESEIEKDPDPAAAWAWFFERMMSWEQKQHALFFAQHYVRDMLQHGEQIPALKVIMRCRLIDERFRPFPEDMSVAVSAAEAHGNSELAAVLKRL